VACGALLVTSGCGGSTLDVETPTLTGPTARVCGQLVDGLPATVDSAQRREVEPSGGPAAAWGDPPIVLRCGVPMPESFDEFAACQETDGVGWFIPEEQQSGDAEAITMTTIDRTVNVEVTLPPEHWPPANAMVDLAPAIKRYVDQGDPCV
jgi:Protein of unknown function (DUF3515)